MNISVFAMLGVNKIHVMENSSDKPMHRSDIGARTSPTRNSWVSMTLDLIPPLLPCHHFRNQKKGGTMTTQHSRERANILTI